MELTALLTLWRLGLTDLIGQRFEHLYIAQSALDEISRAISSLRRFGSDKTMGIQNGMIRLTEMSPELLELEAVRLETLLNEVSDKGIIVPVKSILDLGQKEFENLESIIGREQLDTILIANETGAHLYTDDLWLRVLARDMFSVNGFWTQALLNDVVQNQTISIDEYFDHLLPLISSNYHYVTVNEDFFLYLFEKNSWAITEEIQVAFHTLEGPDITLESAINIVAKIIREAWFKKLLTERRLGVLDTCLMALCTNREPIFVFAALRQVLPVAFALAPVQLQEIDRHIILSGFITSKKAFKK